jgi:hypothetical protein
MDFGKSSMIQSIRYVFSSFILEECTGTRFFCDFVFLRKEASPVKDSLAELTMNVLGSYSRCYGSVTECALPKVRFFYSPVV